LRGDCVAIVHQSRPDVVSNAIAAPADKVVVMLHDIEPLEFLSRTTSAGGQSSSVRTHRQPGFDGLIANSAAGGQATTRNDNPMDRVRNETRNANHRPGRLRIAWVSTWDVRCGIAEHSRSLLEPWIDQPNGPCVELTILCDDRTPPSTLTEHIKVLPCWNGVDPGTDRVSLAVSDVDADLVVIQHQPGLIKWSELLELLNDPHVKDRKIVVELHAVPDLADLEPDSRAAVMDSLRRVARILVHRPSDIDLLQRLGGVSNVALLPLGADRQFCVPLTRSLTEKSKIVIGCYGFFLPGKGIDRLIEAFAILKRSWPGLWLQLTNADYSEASSGEIARCRDLAGKLGVLGVIEWDTAFHTHEESMLKLAQCDLIVLPYEANKESASAALHSAMASGVPIAVTPVSVFDEAEQAVFRFADTDVRSIAKGIDDLLRSRDLRYSTQIKAAAWLTERNWAASSRRLQDLLMDLSD
jgi:glycosyltransferase involved in cell wall biosynthesis